VTSAGAVAAPVDALDDDDVVGRPQLLYRLFQISNSFSWFLFIVVVVVSADTIVVAGEEIVAAASVESQKWEMILFKSLFTNEEQAAVSKSMSS
jgi:hypothetical protein